jgi:hypothetical protein
MKHTGLISPNQVHHAHAEDWRQCAIGGLDLGDAIMQAVVKGGRRHDHHGHVDHKSSNSVFGGVAYVF